MANRRLKPQAASQLNLLAAVCPQLAAAQSHPDRIACSASATTLLGLSLSLEGERGGGQGACRNAVRKGAGTGTIRVQRVRRGGIGFRKGNGKDVRPPGKGGPRCANRVGFQNGSLTLTVTCRTGPGPRACSPALLISRTTTLFYCCPSSVKDYIIFYCDVAYGVRCTVYGGHTVTCPYPRI